MEAPYQLPQPNYNYNFAARLVVVCVTGRVASSLFVKNTYR